MSPAVEASTKNIFDRNLLMWGWAVSIAHFLMVIWHLVLLLKTQPDAPKFLPPLLIVLNLLPLAGVALFAKHWRKLAALFLGFPLVTGLIIGGYAHFFSSGSDNIFNMPPGGVTLQFQVSAVLLVLLEICGCWIALRMFLTRDKE